jgi:hypothetical protein
MAGSETSIHAGITRVNDAQDRRCTLNWALSSLLSRLGQASSVTNDLAGSITGGVQKRACREPDGRY